MREAGLLPAEIEQVFGMKPENDLASIQRAIHGLSESDRATLRAYVLTVFNVRGRDTRVNLTPADHDRPRLR